MLSYFCLSVFFAPFCKMVCFYEQDIYNKYPQVHFVNTSTECVSVSSLNNVGIGVEKKRKYNLCQLLCISSTNVTPVCIILCRVSWQCVINTFHYMIWGDFTNNKNYYIPHWFSLYFTIIGNRPVNSWTGRLNWTATYPPSTPTPAQFYPMTEEFDGIFTHMKQWKYLRKAGLYRRAGGVVKALDPLL